MSRFLITGANGFVGHHFIEMMGRYHGSTVLAIDKKPSTAPKKDFVEYRALDLLDDKDKLTRYISDFRPDYVLHLAAISSVSQSWNDPGKCIASNTLMYSHLLDATRIGHPNARILLVGSSEVYGSQDIRNMPINESGVTKPNNPYGISRLAQEYLTALYVNSYGMKIMMTRSFNHIGPGQSSHFVIPSFVKQLLELSRHNSHGKLITGNTDVVRDFSDVRDVVNAYRLILQNGKPGTVYNICSGTGYALRDIIQTISQLLNVNVEIEVDPSRIRPQDTPVIIGDNTLIKKTLGWIPSYSLTRTINDIISDMKSRINY